MAAISRKITLLVALPLVFELVFVGTLAVMLHQVNEEREKENYARDLTSHVNSALTSLLDRFSSCILYHVSDSQLFRKRFEHSRTRINAEISYLRRAVADPEHVAERAMVSRVETLLTQCIEHLQTAQGQLETGNKMLAARQWILADRTISELFVAIDDIVVSQQGQLEKRRAAQKAYMDGLEGLLVAGVIFNIALAFGLAYYFNRGTTARLKTVSENSLRLALDQPLAPPVTGDDEIAVLDKSFRQMAFALAESRRKERAVVDNAKDVICCIDREAVFTEVNPAAEKLWGFKGSNLVGTSLFQLLPEADGKAVQKLLESIVMDPSRGGDFETGILTASGAKVDFAWSVSWSPADRTFFCVARDITERKQIEDMKRDFVAMVSHDLRTPLTSIQMVLSLFAAGAYGQVTESGQENLAAAEGNVARLISLVNGLLDLEKMEGGKLELLRESTPVTELISASVAALRGFAEQQGVKIESGAVPDRDVFADRDRIVQVLVNLLANAVKFSPKPGLVRLLVLPEETSMRFLVVDQGRGIPASMREAIFERFRQVDAADQKVNSVPGSGLGLTICKAIVERHGGKIGVESLEGKGSTFWFTLPFLPGSVVS
ncbi:MAG: ATP-binding protein [Candidatus Obscuribacter sp.]|nr:PAS domain S-box protein [Candidatus Melainabacteria bacterium]MDX1989200.1 ATP-binding protein [Candidatus Obscuribacter sp.]